MPKGCLAAEAVDEEKELETKLTPGAEPKDATPNEKGDAVEDAAELEIELLDEETLLAPTGENGVNVAPTGG